MNLDARVMTRRVAASYLKQLTRRPLTRLATAAALRAAAKAAFDSLPLRLQGQVEHFLFGVTVGKAQPLEAHAGELYNHYEPVRALLRSKHGMSLVLYRGEPKDKPPIKRRFLSWTASPKLAATFAQAKGYEVVEANVRVSDVVAGLISPHNDFYVEYLVKDRPEYHERGEGLPLVGDFLYFPGGGDDPKDFTELAENVARKLREAVQDAGGKVLQLKIYPRDECLSGRVQLPASTPVDAYDRATTGKFVFENMRPVAR